MSVCLSVSQSVFLSETSVRLNKFFSALIRDNVQNVCEDSSNLPTYRNKSTGFDIGGLFLLIFTSKRRPLIFSL